MADEIDLVDIIRILWGRKKLVIVGTLLLTFAAVGGILILPKTYEVSAILKPGTRAIFDEHGQIVDEMPMVTPRAISEDVQGGAYNTQVQEALNISAGEFPNVKVAIPANGNWVKLTVESVRPQQTTLVLDELIVQVSKDLQKKFMVAKKRLENEIELAQINSRALNSKMKLIEKQIVETTGTVQDLEKKSPKVIESQSDDALYTLLYLNELQNNQIYLNGLREKLNDLEAEVLRAGLNIENLRLRLTSYKDTDVNKISSVPKQANKKKTVLIAALAFFVGLCVMTMYVLMQDFFWRSNGVNIEAEQS